MAGAFCAAVITQTKGQVVEVPRDEGAKSAQQHVEAESFIEQTVPAQPTDVQITIKQANSAPAVKPVVAQTQPTSAKPTLEQMRGAGALAAQRAKNETRSEQSHATSIPSSQGSKIEPIVARPLDRQVREAELMSAQPVRLHSDPIYSIGDGVVVFARDCHMGWGNVVIVRHAYREFGMPEISIRSTRICRKSPSIAAKR